MIPQHKKIVQFILNEINQRKEKQKDKILLEVVKIKIII